LKRKNAPKPVPRAGAVTRASASAASPVRKRPRQDKTILPSNIIEVPAPSPDPSRLRGALLTAVPPAGTSHVSDPRDNPPASCQEPQASRERPSAALLAVAPKTNFKHMAQEVLVGKLRAALAAIKENTHAVKEATTARFRRQLAYQEVCAGPTPPALSPALLRRGPDSSCLVSCPAARRNARTCRLPLSFQGPQAGVGCARCV